MARGDYAEWGILTDSLVRLCECECECTVYTAPGSADVDVSRNVWIVYSQRRKSHQLSCCILLCGVSD
jgi:hypothetical protein